MSSQFLIAQKNIQLRPYKVHSYTDQECSLLITKASNAWRPVFDAIQRIDMKRVPGISALVALSTSAQKLAGKISSMMMQILRALANSFSKVETAPMLLPKDRGLVLFFDEWEEEALPLFVEQQKKKKKALPLVLEKKEQAAVSKSAVVEKPLIQEKNMDSQQNVDEPSNLQWDVFASLCLGMGSLAARHYADFREWKEDLKTAPENLIRPEDVEILAPLPIVEKSEVVELENLLVDQAVLEILHTHKMDAAIVQKIEEKLAEMPSTSRKQEISVLLKTESLAFLANYLKRSIHNRLPPI